MVKGKLVIDAFAAFDAMAGGFANTTDAYLPDGLVAGLKPDDFMYWDGVHATIRVHQPVPFKIAPNQWPVAMNDDDFISIHDYTDNRNPSWPCLLYGAVFCSIGDRRCCKPLIGIDSMDVYVFNYLLLAAMWSAYCAVHSVTISPPFLRWVRKRFPNGHRYHRLAFNLFSVLTLIPVAVYTLSLNTAPLFEWNGHLRWLQAAFIVTGITLIIAGASNYDFKEFLGLSQISSADACRSIGKDCELKTAGILGVVRHPWYTAVVFLLWARDLDPAAFIVNTVLTAYVVIGTHLEERKLIAAFGQTYRDYQKEVSMFLPIKWLKSKLDRTSHQ